MRGKGVATGPHLARLTLIMDSKRTCFDFKKDQIDAISEVAHNILRNGIDFKPEHIQELKKHAALIRSLANRKQSVKKKREALVTKKGVICSDLWKVSL